MICSTKLNPDLAPVVVVDLFDLGHYFGTNILALRALGG